MLLQKLRILAVSLLFLLLALPLAAAPRNDKVAKAIKLSGLAGDVTNATNVGATSEFFEFPGPGQAGKTVWYSYTAPADGYLLVTYDSVNSTTFGVWFNAFRLLKRGKSPDFQPLHPLFLSLSSFDRRMELVPLQSGATAKLQFDSDNGFDTNTAGTFSFSYRLITGSTFRVEGATRPGGQFVWRENEGTVSLVVVRSGSTEGPASVDYQMYNPDGDPEHDPDGQLDTTLSPFSGTLQFAPGEARKTIQFPIINDAVPEETQNFAMFFSPSADSPNTIVWDEYLEFDLVDDDRAPANDQFASPVTLAGANPSTVIPEGIATTQAGEPAGLSASTWFQWTAIADGVVTLSTDHSETIALFTGNTLGTLVRQRPVDTSRNPGEFASEGINPASFVVHTGTTYRIALCGVDSDSNGPTTLTLALADVYPTEPETAVSTFRFARKYSSVVEGNSVTFTVQRQGNTSQPSSVTFDSINTDDLGEDFSFEDHEHILFDNDVNFDSPLATPGVDFPLTTQTLDFGIGEVEKTVTLDIPRQTEKEKIQIFYVRLGKQAENTIVDAPSIAAVRILEKQVAPEHDAALYAGVLTPTGGPGGRGNASLKLTATGSYTGKLYLDGKKFTLKSAFTGASQNIPGDFTTSTQTFRRTGLPDLGVSLRYEVDPFHVAHITGTASDGVTSANFTLHPQVSLRSGEPSPIGGRFTVVLTPDAGVPAAIRQPGYLTLEVTAKAVVKAAGGLPDGSKFTGTGFVTLSGFDPEGHALYAAYFAAPLYKNAGQLTGQLQFNTPGGALPTVAEGDGRGTLEWVHPAVTTGPVLTPFVGTFDAFISRHHAAKTLGGTPPTPILLEFLGNGLNSGPLAGTFSTKGAFTFPTGTPGKPSVKYTAATGVFTGKYTSAGATKALSFQGVVTRNRFDGTGYLLNGPEAGKVTLKFE